MAFKDKESQKKWYEAHKDEQHAYSKEYYKEHKNELLPKQKIRYQLNKVEIRKQQKEYMKTVAGKKIRSQNRKDYWQRIKDKAFEKLGNKCIECGFSDKRALQVDHINGNGVIERKNRKRSSLVYYLKILQGNTSNYQLLCANCNWIKRCENNEHLRYPGVPTE